MRAEVRRRTSPTHFIVRHHAVLSFWSPINGGSQTGLKSQSFRESRGKILPGKLGLLGAYWGFSGPIGAFLGPIGTNSSPPHSHGGRAEITLKGAFLARLAPFGPRPRLLTPPQFGVPRMFLPAIPILGQKWLRQFYGSWKKLRKILVSVKFLSAILGLEMGASILWTPGKMRSFCSKNHVLKIPRFRGGGVFWVYRGGGGGSADFILWARGFF